MAALAPVVPVAAVGHLLLAHRQLEQQVQAQAPQAVSHYQVGRLPLAAQEEHVSPSVKRRLQQSGWESLAPYLH